jgi:hypothetical protein
MSSSTFFKSHPRLSLIFVNLTLLLFILIVFEIVLRIFTPNWLQYKMDMLKSGEFKGFGTDANWQTKYKNGQFYSFIPNSTFKIYHPEYENTVHINSLGGRSNVANEIADTNNIIPFTGDSFIMGVGVEDTETMVSLSRKNISYNFLNLGIAGTGIHMQRKVIDSRLNELNNPKVVIYGFWTGNDFDDEIKESIRDSTNIKDSTNHTVNNEELSEGFGWKFNSFINHNKFLNKLYFLQFLKQKILNIKNKQKKTQDIDPFFLIINDQNTSYINQTKYFLNKEIEALSKEPYKSVFIIIPDKYQIYSDLRKTMISYYNLDEKNINTFLPNEILKEILNKYKISYIDATECLITHQTDGKLYYVQDNHFTKLGQKIISDCVSDSLQKIIVQLK